MHKRSWHPFYTAEGSYYLILYTRSSVRPFAMSCVRNSSYSFQLELDLFEICHNGTQSFRHPVISAPSQFDTFCSFRPIFCTIRTTFFLQQMVVSTPFIFLVPNPQILVIEEDRNVLLCVLRTESLCTFMFFHVA